MIVASISDLSSGLRLELSWNENEGGGGTLSAKNGQLKPVPQDWWCQACRDSCWKTVRERIRDVRTFNGCAVCGVTGEADE